MKKFLIFAFLFIVALVAFVFVARNQILKAAIETGVTSLTGFKTKVDSLKYDFPSTIQIQGLQIDNPEGFNEKVFVNIPEIYISLVLPELLQGKRLYLPEMRLNIQEVHLEKNEKGVSNVELLSTVGGQAKPQPSAAPAEKKAPAEQKPPIPFLLERFELTIRDVTFQDRSGVLGASPVPNRIAVDLNVDKEVFTEISSPQALVNLILVKILNGATFGRLLNISPDKLLSGNLSNAIGSGKELLGQQAETLTQGFKNVSDTGVDTTAAAKDKIAGFLGKMKSLQPGETTTAEKTQ